MKKLRESFRGFGTIIKTISKSAYVLWELQQMTLAQWMRDSLGDVPDATYIQYEGKYRLVLPCRQKDHQHDQVRSRPAEMTPT